MRAVLQHRFGGPEVLEVTEVDPPQGLPSEVIVRVKAVGLNPVEAFIRSGAFPLLGAPPFILGWDISGTIERVVPGVNRFKVGDEVYGMPLFPRPASAYAEFVAAPSRQLAKKPKGVDHVHAAALPLAGLTAWQSLIDLGELRGGERVLIHGAGGGVGHLAVQIAKAVGAYVIATSSVSKLEFVRNLGADEVLDYKEVDFSQSVRDVDVVLESIGHGYAERSIRSLRPGGLLISLVERTNTELATRVESEGRRFAGITVEPDSVGLERLKGLVESRALHIHVDRTFPIEQVAQAHYALNGSTKGKLVLTV